MSKDSGWTGLGATRDFIVVDDLDFRDAATIVPCWNFERDPLSGDAESLFCAVNARISRIVDERRSIEWNAWLDACERGISGGKLSFPSPPLPQQDSLPTVCFLMMAGILHIQTAISRKLDESKARHTARNARVWQPEHTLPANKTCPADPSQPTTRFLRTCPSPFDPTTPLITQCCIGTARAGRERGRMRKQERKKEQKRAISMLAEY